MKTSHATVRIVGLTPLSQSRQHDEPRIEGEGHDDYDKRTWRAKLNTGAAGTIVIPQHGMHQALIAAGKYSGKQIPGQGKKTWTAKLTTGLAFFDEIDTGIHPDEADSIVISANSDGMRGSGRRVPRKFPMLYEWSADVNVVILDPIITESVLREFFEIAGMFIGVGRFRPEKGGSNGRWRVESVDWRDGALKAA